MNNGYTVSENGVVIRHFCTPALHGFCLCLYIKAGALYESDSENGISHFWEHMLFRSVNNALGGELYRKIDSLGATFDAVTYRELIQLRISGAKENFRECAELLTTVFTPFSASAAETDIERRRIKSEIRESDEPTSLDFFTRKIVWNGTSLENPIIGRRSILDKIGPTALAKVQERILSPENIFFCLTGAFTESDVEYLSHLTGQYRLLHAQKRNNLAPLPSDFGKRGAQIHIKNSDCSVVRFNFDADCSGMTQAEQYLLYDVLFSGECSMLFKSLSDETGLVYSYDACFEKYNNAGNLYFYYELANGKIYEAVKRTMSVLNSLRSCAPKDFECTKAAYIINSGLLLDDPEELNWQIGYEYYVMGREFVSIEDRRESFRSVSAERISEIAREIFTPDNFVLTMKAPKKKTDAEKVRNLLKFV